MPNQVQIVNALGSTGCWTCESHNMEGQFSQIKNHSASMDKYI